MTELERRLERAVADSFPFIDGEDFESWVARARDEHHGRRAMLAAVIVGVSRGIQSENAARKRSWIAAARLEFRPRRQEACFVCGKFDNITQAHHVVPLGEQFTHGFRVADQEHEWLCPNHHAILHLWIDARIDDQQRGRRAVLTIGYVEDTELDRMLDLVRRSGRRVRLSTAMLHEA